MDLVDTTEDFRPSRLPLNLTFESRRSDVSRFPFELHSMAG